MASKIEEGAIVIFHDYGWAEDIQKMIGEYVKPLAKKEITLPNMYAVFISKDKLNA